MVFIASNVAFYSCSQNDELSETDAYQIVALEISKGRVKFDSKEHFQSIHSQLKEEEKTNRKGLARILYNELYAKDFNSLYPLVDAQDSNGVLEEKMVAMSENLTMAKSSSNVDPMEHFDDLEDVLGDAAFSALLNNNAEIQIGNQVFKYTDAGLFIAPVSKYSLMIDHLNEKQLALPC